MEVFNEEQKEFVDVVIAGVSKPDFRIVLDASGGTGKTYTLRRLVKMLKDLTYYPIVLAPTHKAKSLFLREHIKANTIHRFFSSTEDIDEETGEVYFKLSGVNKSIIDNDKPVIIVDECSMVNSEMFKMFMDLQYPVIFTGDKNQINPVKEDISKAFSLPKQMSFKKNMRIRANPDSLSAVYLKKFKLAVETQTKIQIENRVSYKFMVDKFKELRHHYNDAVILAWTNIAASNWSKIIRKELFGENPDNYYVGEKLIYSGYRRINKELTYYSSDIIIIKKIELKILDVPYGRCPHMKDDKDILMGCSKCCLEKHKTTHKQLTFYQITDQNGVIWNKVIDSDKTKLQNIYTSYKKMCCSVKSKDIWKGYYDHKKWFNPELKYSYSSTVHKYQGSQSNVVFVDIDNIRLNKNRAECARLSYTAVSRFIDYVYFLKSLTDGP